MKRLLCLVLILLLLSGCAAPQRDITETTQPPTEPTTVQEPFGYYLPGSAIEKESGGALRPYPLNSSMCYGMYPLGDDLLVITGKDLGDETGPVTMERVTGDNLYVTAKAIIPDLHFVGPSTVSTGPRGITCYNEETLDLIFLDNDLRELRRLKMPDVLVGYPAVSPDWSTVYYCTESGIRALDPESGLDRLLKESHESYKTL